MRPLDGGKQALDTIMRIPPAYGSCDSPQLNSTARTWWAQNTAETLNCRALAVRTVATRRWEMQAIKITPALRRKNAALAGALVGFVGLVYYYTYTKMSSVRLHVVFAQ